MLAHLGVGSVLLRLTAAGAFAVALSFVPLHSFGLPPLPFQTSRDEGEIEPVADPAQLLPDELWVAAEGRDLGALARGWLDTKLHQRVTASRAWAKFEKSPQHAQLLAGLGFVQLVSGMKPNELAGALLGERLVAGLVPDGEKPGLAAVLRTGDADVAAHLLQVARGLAAANEEARAKLATAEHRGVELLGFDGKLWVGVIGGDLVAASSEPLARGLIDRARDSAAARRVPALVAAMRGRVDPDALLQVAADVRKLSTLRPDGRLAPKLAEQGVGTSIAGDLVELACNAEFLTAQVVARGDEVGLRLTIPGDPAALPERFRSFCAAKASDGLLALAPPGTVLTISMRRDWARFWEDRAELCAPSTEPEFAELKTNLALFFGGRSLPDEILPAIDDELIFVLSRQTYPGIEAPVVRYPAGAFVYRARHDAEKLGQEFGNAVHSLVAFTNIDRAMKNLTPLNHFVEEFEGCTVHGGRYPAGDDRPADDLRDNLSFVATRVDDRIILASSEELLHDLVRELRGSQQQPAGPGRTGLAPSGVRTLLRADGEATAALVRDNREALIGNAMVKEGKSREEAEQQLDILAEILDEVSHATLSARDGQDAVTVELALALEPLVPATAVSPAAVPAGGGSR